MLRRGRLFLVGPVPGLPGGPYAQFPARARQMLETQEQRLRDARDPAVPVRGNTYDPAQRAQARLAEIKKEEAEFVKRKQEEHFLALEQEEMMEKHMEEQEQRMRQDPFAAAAAAAVDGPGVRGVRPERRTRLPHQVDGATPLKSDDASASSSSSSTRSAPPRPTNDKPYRTGSDVVATQLNIFGSRHMAEPTGRYHGFKMPTPEESWPAEEGEGEAEAEVGQQQQQQQSKSSSSSSTAAATATSTPSTSSSSAAPAAQKRRSGVHFFRAAKKGDTREDPFIAAFAPSGKADPAKKLAAEQQRLAAQYQHQQDHDGHMATTPGGGVCNPASSPSSGATPFATPDEQLEVLTRQKKQQLQEVEEMKQSLRDETRAIKAPALDEEDEQQQQSNSPPIGEKDREFTKMIVQAYAMDGAGRGPTDAAEAELSGGRSGAFGGVAGGGMFSSPGEIESMATGDSSSPGSQYTVGGQSVGEWRQKIKRIRARGEGNLVVRLQGEIGYAHILAQTGRPADAQECLEVGEYVWKKLDELKHASPDSAGGTHGIVINICSAMRRAGKTLGMAAEVSKWEGRLEGSTRQMQDRIMYSNRGAAQARDMEPGKEGARKHKMHMSAVWGNLRNPLFKYPWAKKYVDKDPDEGPRWTMGTERYDEGISNAPGERSGDNPGVGKRSWYASLFG